MLLSVTGCTDSDRQFPRKKENTPARCSDRQDNDRDGFTDCADQDCAKLAVCHKKDAAVDDSGWVDRGTSDQGSSDQGSSDADLGQAGDGPGLDQKADLPPDMMACPKGTACVTYKPGDGGCVPVHAKSGTKCNDGVTCTKADQCNGAGKCEGTAYICAPGTCEARSKCEGKGG